MSILRRKEGRLALLSVLITVMFVVGACVEEEDTPTPASTSTTTATATPAASPTSTPVHRDPTVEEILLIEENANTTDAQVTMNDSPDPAVPGEALVYTLMVTNKGPNSADYVRVVVILPLELSYVSDIGGCVEDGPGTLTCDLGYVEVREGIQFVVTAMIDADVVLDGDGPIVITNEASVVNLAGPNSLHPFDHIWPDLDPSNNSTAEETGLIIR